MTLTERINLILPRRADVISDEDGVRVVCYESGANDPAARCDGTLTECEAFAREWIS